MPERSLVGTRIRERRLSLSMRQAELAQRAGISASYLNLIEHNRRRIGGKLLINIADVLGVEPATLSEGAEATLVAGLRAAAGAREEIAAEIDRADEFAGRFPGWARLLAADYRRIEALERSVHSLTDRLGHDPQLAASLHEVLSAITAVHSTASILVETDQLEPEWQARFHRNLNEDSRRLAEGAEALVRYLDNTPDPEAEITAPLDEIYRFAQTKGYHFPSLENGDETAIDDLVSDEPTLGSSAAQAIAARALRLYAQDATALPLGIMQDALETVGLQPDLLAERCGVGLAQMFRRLACMPAELTGPVGLVVCDGAGAMLFRKPISGFDLPRGGGACPLWPLYRTLAQPGVPVRMRLRQAGRNHETVIALAVSEIQSPQRIGTIPVLRSYMLLLPDTREFAAVPVDDVGTTCRICPRTNCPARREPSFMADGF